MTVEEILKGRVQTLVDRLNKRHPHLTPNWKYHTLTYGDIQRWLQEFLDGSDSMSPTIGVVNMMETILDKEDEDATRNETQAS